MPEAPMSFNYRAMIYAAVATMYFYRKDILPLAEGENLGSFYQKNRAVMDRVCEELNNLFGYELSHEQVGKAIRAYICPAQSVTERPAATLQS
ncbi:MAG: hypothetical protein ABL917_04185 [Parcubacteria group bacterium]